MHQVQINGSKLKSTRGRAHRVAVAADETLAHRDAQFDVGRAVRVRAHQHESLYHVFVRCETFVALSSSSRRTFSSSLSQTSVFASRRETKRSLRRRPPSRCWGVLGAYVYMRCIRTIACFDVPSRVSASTHAVSGRRRREDAVLKAETRAACVRRPYTRARLDSTRQSSRSHDASTNILDFCAFIDIVDTSRRALCLHLAVSLAFLSTPSFPPLIRLVPTQTRRARLAV